MNGWCNTWQPHPALKGVAILEGWTTTGNNLMICPMLVGICTLDYLCEARRKENNVELFYQLYRNIKTIRRIVTAREKNQLIDISTEPKCTTVNQLFCHVFCSFFYRVPLLNLEDKWRCPSWLLTWTLKVSCLLVFRRVSIISYCEVLAYWLVLVYRMSSIMTLSEWFSETRPLYCVTEIR